MLRRRFVSICSGLTWFVGVCGGLAWIINGRRGEDPREQCPVLDDEPSVGVGSEPAVDAASFELVRDRIAQQLPATTRFEPLTLIMLVNFVLRLLQVCRTAAILRQQIVCGRAPDGLVARRIKARLHDRFAAENPEISDAVIQEHVDAAMRAFVHAKRADLVQVKHSLDQTVQEPTRIELFDYVEDLSK
jgi:hypothetical protein